MAPVLVDALLAILRWLATLAAGWFVGKGIWTQPAAAGYVQAFMDRFGGPIAMHVAVWLLGLGALAWSLVQKWRAHALLNTALKTTPGKPLSYVKWLVKMGAGEKAWPK